MAHIDISQNLNEQNKLDLIYLTNGVNLDKLLFKKKEVFSKEYLEKYKDIILKKTNELLDMSSNNYSQNLYHCFKQYVKVIIDDYEFNKKKEIIQNQYKHFKKIKNVHKKTKIDVDIGSLDVTILKKKEKKSNLNAFIKKKKKKVKKIVYPKKIVFKK